MATLNPVSITGVWTQIYSGRDSGAFVGSIQALDNKPVYVRVTTSVKAPPATVGGFMLGNEIYPFAVAATEIVWARAADGAGEVVMG